MKSACRNRSRLPGAPIILSARGMFDLYFTIRLLQELRCADEATDCVERLAHLEACRHYEQLLTMLEVSQSLAEPPADAGRRNG